MSANKLKDIYEVMTKNIKFIFAPIFRALMNKNKEYIKTWEELDRFEKLSLEEQKKVQFSKLKQTLIYAYEYVPYYKKIFDEAGFDVANFNDVEELKKLPMLDKNIAVQEGENLYSTENIAYYESHTSGSTG